MAAPEVRPRGFGSVTALPVAEEGGEDEDLAKGSLESRHASFPAGEGFAEIGPRASLERPHRKPLRAHSLGMSLTSGENSMGQFTSLRSVPQQLTGVSTSIKQLEEKMLHHFETLSENISAVNVRLEVLAAGEAALLERDNSKGTSQVPLIGRPTSRTATNTSLGGAAAAVQSPTSVVAGRRPSVASHSRRPSNASLGQLTALPERYVGQQLMPPGLGCHPALLQRRPSDFSGMLPYISDQGSMPRTASETDLCKLDRAATADLIFPDGGRRPSYTSSSAGSHLNRIAGLLHRSYNSHSSTDSSNEDDSSSSDDEGEKPAADKFSGDETFNGGPVWSLSPVACVVSPSSLALPGTDAMQKPRQGSTVRPSLTLEGPLLDMPPRWMLMPDSPLRLAWDLVTVVATFLASVLMPLHGVYFEEAYHPPLSNGMVESICLIVDTLWAIDVVLNFRTALAKNGRSVTKPSAVARAYVRSWFMFDVLTAWPRALVPAVMADTWTCLKFVRLVRSWRTLGRVQKELKYLIFMPAKLMLGLLLSVHFLSCTWRIILRSEGDTPEEHQWFQLLAKDAYFVMMTITTVGYGDITPRATGSRLFAICLMIAPPIFNGCVILMVQHLAKDLLNDEEHRQVAEACRFMRRHKVNAALQRRVEHSLRSRINEERRLCTMPSIMRSITSNLQRELTLELLSSTLLCFPLFVGVPSAFIAEVAEAHQWVQCGGGDLVVEAGQVEQELVFVVSGKLVLFCSSTCSQNIGLPSCHSSSSLASRPTFQQVQVLDADGHLLDRELALSTGAWFGEACLFQRHSVRAGTVYARTDSELAVLHVRHYKKILKTYPSLEKRHEQIAKHIKRGVWKIEELVYKPDQAPHGARRMARRSFWKIPRGTMRLPRRGWPFGRQRCQKVADASAFTGIGQ